MEEPIAIVGVSARLPGDGDTPERFYDSLLAGRSARTEVPRERYNADAFWHPNADRSGATRVRHGHFLKGSISAFDAPFFSITPTEARSIDPQQRGMLESVYKALENAGIPLDTVAGSQTGVYVGCFTADYNDHIAKDLDIPNKYSALGTVASMLSNRVSWFFDFRGPSVTVDTACSSSLVAVHEACMSLKLREISMAVVGGCNLILTPEMTLKLDAAGVLGPDGKSYSFDHRANGYARGEGFGAVVLKRVSDAVRDGDVIRAVIRNSSTNQDGRSPGITQPTKAGQVALIKHVYDRANLDPSLTRFAEAHGTGTPVGDPIEASALAEMFAPHRSQDEPLFIGALKSNVGHLEGAAGVAAVIKGVLTLESGVIPGNIWFEKKNPRIQDSWNLKFPTEPTVWPQRGLRRISINSFGVGGSNAHVVMDDALHFLKNHRLNGNHRTEASPHIPRHLTPGSTTNGDYPINRPRRSDSGVELSGYECEDLPRLFVLSGNDPDAASRLKKLYKEYLSAKVAEDLGETAQLRFLRDLSHTLASRRTHHAWRSVSIAGSPTQLQKALDDGGLTPTKAKPNPRLAFVFTGQGAQWAAMGMDLLAYRAFQESLFAADRYLNDLGCRWSLTFELSKPKTSSRIDDPEFCQPICTALQVAQVDLLTSWGIYPHAITGHSSGEVAAAYAAGAIPREAAWKVAYHRGRLSAKLARSESRPKTGMAAVGLDKAGTEAAIGRLNQLGGEGTLEIACMNSSDSHTVSGDARKIDRLVEMLGSDKVFARKLNVDIAYHSQYMKPMADEYLRAMGELGQGVLKSPFEPRFYSSTVGAPIALSRLRQPDYWVENLVSPVRFTESVTEMLKGSSQPKVNGHVNGVNGVNGDEPAMEPITDFLEIGPHSALKGPLSSTTKQVRGTSKVDYHSVLRRQKSAVETTLEAAGSLFCQGYSVRLAQVNEADEPHGPRPLMLTNLPSYPFDHSKEYWVESTLSDHHRERHAGRHELLGAPMPGFNEDNGTWRNYIRLTESPWIEDHKVSGRVLYPAAGMLVMAIEASRQVADRTKTLEGFRFRDVSFKLALRVPDDANGVESQFYLRQHRESSVSAPSAWKEFQLWTLQNGEWREHCHGFVQTEYELDDHLLALPSIQGNQINVSRGYTTEVSVDKLYRNLSQSGLHFGPTFQTLSNVRLGQGLNMIATVDSPGEKIKKVMPYQYVQPHLVHPATLDAVVHANVVPLVSNAKYSRSTRVPTYLTDGWVSARPELLHDSYNVSAESKLRGRNEVTAEVTATHPEQGQTMVRMSGLLFRTISHEASSKAAKNASTHPAFNIAWRPDPSFLNREQASKLFDLPMSAEDDPSRWMRDCEALCLAYIRRYVLGTSKDTIANMAWYHQRYASWFQHVVRQSSNEAAGEAIADLEARVVASGASEGKLIIAVGNALDDILSGKRDPLDVIFKDKLAEDVYKNGLGSKRCYAQLCSYLDALAHKNPAMEVLEIGGGTGGATRPVMATLTRDGRRYKRYDFTDISPSFFEQAKETFKDELAHMNFRLLNVENDPLAQGFEAGRYDVIVAANVLHATKKMDDTLSNARRLLKPGGRLLLFEITNTEVLLGSFCFGVLPGWWLSEDKDRIWGPLMSPVSWSHHLTNAGFSGLDAVFHDFPSSPYQMSSILVSTVPRPDKRAASLMPTYVLTSGTPAQAKVAKDMSQSIGLYGPCDVTTAEAIATRSLAGSACVVLSEFDRPCLADMTEEMFESFKHVLVRSKLILWVTRGGTAAAPDPDAELVTGLARVVRAERPDVKFLTASFAATASEYSVAEKCVQILRNAQDDAENSFRVVDGIVNVPRLVQAKYLTEHLQAQTGSSSVVSRPLGDDTSRPLALQVGDVGHLDSLRFEDDDTFDTPLGDHEVQLKTMACGLTARDLSSALGKTEESPLGCEVSGIVTKAGSSTRFRVGDRVFGLTTSGATKTHARSTDGLLAKLSDGVSWAHGAALPADYTTAYAVLYEFGSLRKGDAVLVQDGASTLGQALIQIAKLKDAKVYATVNNRAERDTIAALGSIPQEHILNGRDSSLRSSLQSLTKGRGVSLVVNTADAPGPIDDVVGCVAPFGRIVSIGSEISVSSARLPRGRNIRLESFDLASCAAHDLPLTETLFQHMVDLVSASWSSISRPTPAAVYSFSQAQDAFRRLQSEGRPAKVVLEPRDQDVVPVMASRKPASFFDPKASYVVAGGLGGLGRSVARWMASRGAKNLILLSRRGAVEKPAIQLVNELKSVCDNVVAPACDVTDEQALINTMNGILTSLPPVKGCIQGSMVLQDNLVQNMSFDGWKAATRPKVDGSRNLCNVLGDKTDFFVFLSSFVSIIGNPEQANYAAGGTFQDALARKMVAQGINAVSIDLPIVEGVGYVAEKPELWDYLRSTGWTHISEEELYAVLDYHCRPAADKPAEVSRAQVIPRVWLPRETAVEGYQTHSWGEDPLFSHLQHTGNDDEGKADETNKTLNHKALLRGAASREEVEGIVLDALLLKIARMLSIEVSNLEFSRPLHAYGIDSLTAVELRSWLLKELGAEVIVFDITNNSSISQLAALAATKSSLAPDFSKK
ncbi:beta-ketoacyl synthase domain-containing protein [Colletotrichum graminicola]|uniref:Beta-ketoacyl synthase domain-containing protein n=1 Tax=Colletotrichum graminicola (strain M1.001 / M2 / FGSC 10212) TaxID=645133 RepID=E3Q9I6_COLGM|nr:beta-ketoacyl synthase domain-containing protein [Colletotrichum graminicola M1.001]EFQ27365.1 beta-ketoacyl synthase domain-containing protein [Colletotrichum graminicola M1.001]WDK13158.1 beta-ketoacyl synthase domain-containing protein [Colletotrichum graminicola]